MQPLPCDCSYSVILQTAPWQRCSAPAFGTPGYDYTWATTDPRRLRAGNVEPGPRQYSPRGLRFAISSTRRAWEGSSLNQS